MSWTTTIKGFGSSTLTVPVGVILVQQLMGGSCAIVLALQMPLEVVVSAITPAILPKQKDGKTKDGVLRPKIEEAREFHRRINCPVEFQHINRSANKSADWLANWVLHNKLAKDLTVYEDEIKKREDFRALLDLINEEAS
ncbi:hypothetical protein SUGI_1126280 [Cryptomeria japonica]|nr:hypothetical protein SUGI_1126280 [Cryptomeria japonica]